MADIKEISKKLEEGVKEVYSSKNYLNYLATMAKFHDYSVNNSMLIYFQKPDATLVAGYKSWQTKFNRHVKAGEKGIAIIKPCPHKMTVKKVNKDGEEEEVERKWNSFAVTHVWDISQTEGEDLPKICKRLEGSVQNYDELVEAVRSMTDCSIKYGDANGANGYYDRIMNEIVVQDGMSEAQSIKTLIHELTHSILHRGDGHEKRIMEIQAESVAYIVCNVLGIQTDSYSFEYVASWARTQDAKALNANMETIRNTANRIIDSLSQKGVC